MQDSLNCPRWMDAVFGPRVHPACRSLDFTRLFEDSILSILPSACFLLLSLSRIAWLTKSPEVAKRGRLGVWKLITAVVFVCAELADLAVWSSHPSDRISTSIAVSVIKLVAAFVILLLSQIEHTRTLTPSAVLSVYLIGVLLLDAVRARTVWLAGLWNGISIMAIIVPVLRLHVLVVECIDKTSLFWLQADKERSPEERTGVIGIRLFSWLNALFLQGYKKSLAFGDLFVNDATLSPAEPGSRLDESWKVARQRPSRDSLAKAVVFSLRWPFLAPVIPRLFLMAFTFSQPFLVERVTSLLKEEQHGTDNAVGYSMIAAYGLVYCGIAITTGWYWHKQYRFVTMLRGELVAIIYQKTLRSGAAALSDSQATTLMSADVERIALGVRYCHEIWANVIEAGIALWLLTRQVALAALAMALISLFCAIGASAVSALAAIRQKQWMKSMQSRLHHTSAMLGSVKSVKMLNLDVKLKNIIQGFRVNELAAAKAFRQTNVYAVTLAYVNLTMSPTLVFAAFVAISKTTGAALDSERMFTSLTLISLLSAPLVYLLQALPALAASISCLRRIQAFLLLPEHTDTRRITTITNSTNACEKSTNPDEAVPPVAFAIRQSSFGWKPLAEPILKNINLEIPSGKVTMVTGPVGCGKSCLLHALLGEVLQLKGPPVATSTKDVAFCAQIPWLMNGTIQESIVGFNDFDMNWYEQVLQACGLLQDIRSMPLASQTNVGSGGSMLSGGQKQRVALARAVYCRKRVIIMDDIFSGLDKKTSTHITEALFGPTGLLRGTDVTVILATHATDQLAYADYLIALDGDGRVALQSQQNTIAIKDQSKGEVPQSHKVLATTENPVSTREVKASSKESSDSELSETKSLSDGKIFWYYLQALGTKNYVFFIIFGFLFATFYKFPDLWIRFWTEADETTPGRDDFYLGIYAMFNILACIVLAVWVWHLFQIMAPRSGLILHKRLLTTVLHAHFPTISRVDTGSLVNRFSQDLLLVDSELPMALINTAAEALICIAQLALIATASVILLGAFPVLALVLFVVQKVYLRTSKRLRFLDLEAKSPLYGQFTSTLQGLPTIRAFGWQSSAIAENARLLDLSQRPFYLMYCIQRWLQLVLDLIVAGLAVVVLGIAIGYSSAVGPSSLGVALINLVTLGETLKNLVMSWTLLETSIGAVSRVQSFVEETPLEHFDDDDSNKAKTLPNEASKGMIELTDVTAAYGSNKVLKSISMRIQRGEKVAICGRSGGGKSSLLNTLFNMIDIVDGEIVVDGVRRSETGCENLREHLACIPQEPYFFPGTFLENLSEGIDDVSPDQVWDTLALLELDDKVAQMGGLEATVDTSEWSVGELQKLSVCRVMLQKEKNIIVLDEATASVDQETDKLIHDVIFEKSRPGQTIIAVLHRLELLERFDKVGFLSGGSLVAFGSPSEVKID